MGVNQFSSSPVLQHQELASAIVSEGQYSEAEFERMFEEAATKIDQEFSEIEASKSSQAAQASTETVAEQTMRDHHAEMIEQTIDRHTTMNIAEQLPVEEQKAVEHEGENADDLARTAGQLLDTLSHNQTEKFQQSNFLALMRKLRDHEVKVEGGKMVEVW